MGCILLFYSCGKEIVKSPEPVDPVPVEIKINAYVPPILYSNAKTVALDAGPMLTSYPQHKFIFSWNCTRFPAGKSPYIRNYNNAVAIAENLDSGNYTFVLRVRDISAFNDSAVFNLTVYKDTLTGPPKLTPLPDLFVVFPKAAKLALGTAASMNPIRRELKFYWHVIEQPFDSPPVTIANSIEPDTEATGLQVGTYSFGLSVTNDLRLTTVDTFNITVLADTLTGTTKVYDNLIWTDIPDDFAGTVPGIQLNLGSLFYYRNSSNMDLTLYDYTLNDWVSPILFTYAIMDSVVTIFPNNTTYTVSKGGKASAKISFK